MKFKFSGHIFEKKYSNLKFHENPSIRNRVFLCRQKDMTKLRVAFRSFANESKKSSCFCLFLWLSLVLQFRNIDGHASNTAVCVLWLSSMYVKQLHANRRWKIICTEGFIFLVHHIPDVFVSNPILVTCSVWLYRGFLRPITKTLDLASWSATSTLLCDNQDSSVNTVTAPLDCIVHGSNTSRGQNFLFKTFHKNCGTKSASWSVGVWG